MAPTRRSLLHSLIAVLAGNGVYFAVSRYLPPMARHQPMHLDWGLAVDFWICLVFWGLLRFLGWFRVD